MIQISLFSIFSFRLNRKKSLLLNRIRIAMPPTIFVGFFFFNECLFLFIECKRVMVIYGFRGHFFSYLFMFFSYANCIQGKHFISFRKNEIKRLQLFFLTIVGDKRNKSELQDINSEFWPFFLIQSLHLTVRCLFVIVTSHNPDTFLSNSDFCSQNY